MNEQALEQQLTDKGLVAPRVTPGQVDAIMKGVTYHTHVVPGTTTTVATAIAENGFTLATEVSACASPANFDEQVGRDVARARCEQRARDAVWQLEGWRLKCESLSPFGSSPAP